MSLQPATLPENRVGSAKIKENKTKLDTGNKSSYKRCLGEDREGHAARLKVNFKLTKDLGRK